MASQKLYDALQRYLDLTDDELPRSWLKA